MLSPYRLTRCGVDQKTISNDLRNDSSESEEKFLTSDEASPPTKSERRARREADLAARQTALPTKRYGVILADPEWRFEPYSRETGMDRVCVFSRRGHDWTDRVPRIVEALASLSVTSITLDGEGVVCGPDGVADFDRLRAAVGRKGSRDAFLYAFDLLELDGEDLRGKPWEVRRDALASLLRNAADHPKLGDGIRLSEHIDGADGDIVFRHACKLGLEGIVAKKRDRPYRSGRSTDWIKIRNPNAPAVMRLLEE